MDTKKHHKDEAMQVLPPVLKERPPVLPEVAGNSQKAKRTKLHRAPSSFKALQDVLQAGRRLQHRCTSSLTYRGCFLRFQAICAMLVPCTSLFSGMHITAQTLRLRTAAQVHC